MLASGTRLGPWRRGHGTGIDRNLELRDALVPIAQRHGFSVGPVAVARTLSWPGVTGAIVSARSPEQVDGWISAASLQLTDVDLREIETAIEISGAGTGPATESEGGSRK